MNARTAGRLAYEQDRAALPLYGDGSPRPAWEHLSTIGQESWVRNPTPRNTLPPLPLPPESHDHD